MFVVAANRCVKNSPTSKANTRRSRSNFPERQEKAVEIYRLFPAPSSSHFGAGKKYWHVILGKYALISFAFSCKAVVFFLEIR